MTHKGNFSVTQMGRIALSLQDLVERQAAEIAKLKEVQIEDKKLLKQFRHTNAQLRTKIEKQQEMIKCDMEMMEDQNKVLDVYKKLLDQLQRPWLKKVLDFIKGE